MSRNPNILVQSDDGSPNGRSLIPDRPPTSSAASVPSNPTERLLPPSRQGNNRFRDDDSAIGGASPGSGYSSRRTSWSSDHGSRDSRVYGANPFDDSRAPSRAGSDDEHVNTQTVSEKYNILPSAGLLLFPEDIEKDDYLHNPGPNDNDRDCDIWNKRGLVNLGGLMLLTMGVLMLFVGFPAITFIKHLDPDTDPCKGNADCLGITNVPLLNNVRRGLIDPDTPQDAMTIMSEDGSTQLQLVFSDEFNTPGRTFYDGDDPYFQGMDFWYGVTQDLEWYDPDAITTVDGVLETTFSPYQNHGLNYRSGMLQSWNKMCFKGGRLVGSISLPGAGQTIGFWPGFWAMGNLGRPGYAATTDGMWPYSYHDECDAGITPNQSMTDGTNLLPGMRLPACTCDSTLHPSPGKSRSAPEIDAIEGSVGVLDKEHNSVGVASQSAQFAPFDIFWQADYNFVQVFDDTVTVANVYEGGPYQQTMSMVTNLNNKWYDGGEYQKYAFEYTPGATGKVTWFIGDTKTWHFDARAVRPNGNIGQRVIPEEPMALIANFGMSNNFAALNYTGLADYLNNGDGAKMRIDYIRIYQDPSAISVTCDPPGYPTTDYISKHMEAYTNPNLTHWSQTPYQQPQNALMNGCTASDPDVPVIGPQGQISGKKKK